MGANPLDALRHARLWPWQGSTCSSCMKCSLTETAKQADIVLPAASAYEKDGTVTNTAGEIQSVRKGVEIIRAAHRFRSAADPFSPARKSLDSAKLSITRTPQQCSKKFAKSVAGYNVRTGRPADGRAPNRPNSRFTRNGHAPYDVPVGLIKSAHDNLFTSGTLGKFCSMMESLPEAEAAD